MAFSMLGLALSFLYPATLGSYISIPCLVVAGASYGLGVGPVPFVLMASLFLQKNKSLGVAISQTVHALIIFTLLKVGINHYNIMMKRNENRFAHLGLSCPCQYYSNERTLLPGGSGFSCRSCVHVLVDSHNKRQINVRVGDFICPQREFGLKIKRL